MEVILLALAFFFGFIYLISRIAHYFYNLKKKLDDIDEKLSDIRDHLGKKDM
ncbi:hypothetical protein JOC75_000867 [Metabacillus crassostreae]|uniref:hypothetical protein n=1 Tax=Metabacillus crassostreae TaxID=929098 RepID=UPI0019599DB5|nr:hypothetical protein [Metabacillus crassostreae]MBM7602897.1 hypothetical protein [Metabacillus crassostreae]